MTDIRAAMEPMTGTDLAAHLVADHGMAESAVEDATETDMTEMHEQQHTGGVAPAQTTTGPDTLASRPPRDNLVRSVPEPFELRDGPEGGMPTMVGHFARFNEWTTIDSRIEGRFRERIAPGAFARTFTNNRSAIRALFQHGKDPQIGDKVLGPTEVLEEDAEGARYEVPLLDTSYNRDLVPGLRAGLYGASFRFSVLQEDVNTKPRRSVENPEALPERTIREARVMEFGPVTFPAYAGATASVRSLTDDFLREVLIPPAEPVALAADPGAQPHIEPATRTEPVSVQPIETPQETPVNEPISRADRPARMAEIRNRTSEIATEHTGVLPASIQSEWDGLTAELAGLEADQRADDGRRAFIEQRAAAPETSVERVWEAPTGRNVIHQRVANIYDLAEIRKASRDEFDERQLQQDSAKRELERATFPVPGADKARCADVVESLIDEDRSGEIARRVLLTGAPAYRRAFHKYLTGGIPTADEQRAAALTGLGATTTTGGYATVYELDPTILPTSNGAVNPYRRMSRVVKTTHNEWRGVTSAGVVAVYDTEAAAATEQGPTLAQPAAIVQKAQTFITFSIEAGEDIDNLEGQLAGMIQDSKDVLESVQFSTGVGTTVYPQGVQVGGTNTVNTATTLVLAAGDLYKVEGTLAPRFRPNARFLANRFIYNKVRAIDTAGGAQLWTQNLTVGLPNRIDGNTGYNLLGYPADECSGYPATIAQNDLIATLGDFSYFVIVDKIGLNIELVPLMLNGATPSFPTGQRGLYAYWRNTSKVLSAAAFQTIKVV